MTSAAVGHMQRIQRRRLMAAMLAEAILDGRIEADSIDLNALLFGEPELWERSTLDANLAVSEIQACTPEIAQETLGWDQRRRMQAGKVLEDDIIKRLGIEAAQGRDGKGKSGSDTEYRRVRSKLPSYVQYLAEREVYQRLNHALLNRYAAIRPSASGAEALAAEFALPLSDVQDVIEEVEALVSVSTTPVGAPVAASAAKMAGRRGLILLDTKLRPRWRSQCTRRISTKSEVDQLISQSSAALAESHRDHNAGFPNGPAPELRDPNAKDLAILYARLGQEPSDRLLLSPNWRSAEMDRLRIVELMPYPRFNYLARAFEVFGHPPLRSVADCNAALAEALEAQAAPERRQILEVVNDEDVMVRLGLEQIPHPWWRAFEYLTMCKSLAGHEFAGEVWPDPWDWLYAPHPTTMDADGYRLITELDAIGRTFVALKHTAPENRALALATMRQRGSAYVGIVAFAELTPDPPTFLNSAVRNWLEAAREHAIEELLPGFVTDLRR